MSLRKSAAKSVAASVQVAAQELPPKEATTREVCDWVQGNPDLVLLGEGRHRQAFLMPDGKVFKREMGTASSDPDIFNTDTQTNVYYANEGCGLFPEIYDNGQNWVLEERVQVVDELLGMGRRDWAEAARGLSRCNGMTEVRAMAKENCFVGKLLANKRMRSIIEIFVAQDLSLRELFLDNMGVRANGEIVVLDYATHNDDEMTEG